MGRPSSAGRTSRLVTSDERGAVLALTAVAAFVLVLLFAGLAEFGRWLILREQLQTAADAAALAASYSGAERWVNIDVKTERGERIECDEFGCWCEGCGVSVRNVTGKERDLLDGRPSARTIRDSDDIPGSGWDHYCRTPCSCSDEAFCWYEVKKRWVKYSPSYSRDAADAFFHMNLPGQAEWGGVEDLEFRNFESQRNEAPAVVAKARALMSPIFALFGPGYYQARSCSQADTFYRDPRTGKWVKAPPDYCAR